MESNVDIPIQETPENRRLNRRHTARYYAHRVHESLRSRVFKVICTIFLGLLLILGVIAFILWISLRPHRPRFHVMDFSLPALNQANGFQSALILFNVTARNPNLHIGIHYEAVDGSVYYRDQSIGSTPLLFPFYQPPKNTTSIYGQLSGATLTVNSQRWNEFLNDRATGTVVFRLELTSTIRFKVATWDSKHHRMHVSCEVAVGQDGVILPMSKSKKCPLYFS